MTTVGRCRTKVAAQSCPLIGGCWYVQSKGRRLSCSHDEGCERTGTLSWAKNNQQKPHSCTLYGTIPDPSSTIASVSCRNLIRPFGKVNDATITVSSGFPNVATFSAFSPHLKFFSASKRLKSRRFAPLRCCFHGFHQIWGDFMAIKLQFLLH